MGLAPMNLGNMSSQITNAVSGAERGVGARAMQGKYTPRLTPGMSMEDQRKEMERAQAESESVIGGLQGNQRQGAIDERNRMMSDFTRQQEDDARKNQIRTVEKLEKDAPEIAGRAYGAAALGERRKLAEEMSGIKRGAQRRGLLYSGMRQGAEAGAQAGSASRLAQARVDINRNVGNMVQDAKNKVIQGGLDLQAGQQAMEDAIYSQALSNYQSKVGAGSAIGGGLGMAAGALF